MFAVPFSRNIQLMVLTLTMIPSNAEAERVFSVQNRVKTKLRTRLGINILDELVRVSYSKTSGESLQLDTALAIFNKKPHRWY
jgi:hypothetical protein